MTITSMCVGLYRHENTRTQRAQKEKKFTFSNNREGAERGKPDV
jgi:hypothetical protein